MVIRSQLGSRMKITCIWEYVNRISYLRPDIHCAHLVSLSTLFRICRWILVHRCGLGEMSEDLKSVVSEEQTAMGYYIVEFFSSPINVALLGVCAFLLYKVFKDSTPPEPIPEPTVLPMKKRDFTIEELREFDGTKGEGRILIAVNGKVFDMTRGKKFYGPGGPYEIFAGRDASRGLATMSLDESALKEGPDDLSDLTVSQLDIVKDWEMQFMDKYDHVGRLLKPGEKHSHYDENEEEEEEEEKKSH